MSEHAQEKRILHRERPDGYTVEFALGQIDERSLAAAARAIPFDCPEGFESWLKKCIASGELQSVVLSVDEVEVGNLTFAVVSGAHYRELLVAHCHIADHTFNYIPILKTFCRVTAQKYGCDYVRFHTVRKGLVKQAIDQGFFVSEIVLRLPV